MFGWKKKAEAPKAAGPRPTTPIPADPIEAAAHYVTFVSGGNRPDVDIITLREPLLCTSPMGKGVCYLLDSKQGVSGKMYFFTDFAFAWPDGEDAPRPHIPTAMIAHRVRGHTKALQGVLTLIPRGVDRIAHVSH